MKNILVFGFFGLMTNQLDGQTIKTREVYHLFLQKYNGNVFMADSQNFRYSVKSILKFIRDLLRCDILIYLPAHNNLKYIFPILFLLSKILHFKIQYIVIGGWLDEFIAKKRIHIKMLQSIDHLYVENCHMKTNLQSKYKIHHISTIPNFRNEETFFSPTYSNNGTLRLVFMARINRMKGLDTIFDIAKLIKTNKLNITIDFYGPINKEDYSYFYSEITKYDFIAYNGVLLPQNIVPTLRNYDVLLFPTHYYTEGLPGTIIDAYRAGIPILASNWKYASEFIIEAISGFIVPFENNVPSFYQKILRLYKDPKLLMLMKQHAYKESIKYSSEIAWEILSNRLK